MRLYDETCLALCEGQFMDIWSAEHDERLSVDFYFDMIGRKTAALIAAPSRRARCWPPTTQRVIDAYRGFGWSLGIAFQLNDDLLGIWGDEQTTGKEPSDLAKHKKTLPVIYALEHAAGADRDAPARSSWPTAPRGEPGRADEARAILERVRRARLHARAGRAPSATRRWRSSSRRESSDGEALERLRS